MKQWLFASLLVLSLIVVWGCESSGTRRRLGRAKLGLPIESIDAAHLGYTIQWATAINPLGTHHIRHVAVLGDLIVTVEAPSNLVSAIAVRDGTLLWRRPVGQPVDRLFAPQRNGDVILVNSEKQLFSLDVNNGDVRYVSELESIVGTSPVLIDRYAVFGGLDGKVFGHDIQSGFSKWQYQLTSEIRAQPIGVGNNVFVTDANGFYAMIQAATGRMLWKDPTFGPISATPAANSFAVFVAGQDQKLYALNRIDGRERWVFMATRPLTRGPTVFGNRLYLPLPTGGVVALNAADRAELWRLDTDALPVTEIGNHVLMNGTNQLILVDRQTGRTAVRVPTLPLKTVLEGPDRSLILVTPTGRFLRLDPRA